MNVNIKKIYLFNKDYNLITLKNDNIELVLLDLGATVYSLQTKNKYDKFENIILQYKDITKYFNNKLYFGATIGRMAGRIKNSKISLNKKTYFLEKNYLNKHTLHGGYNSIKHNRYNFNIINNKIIFTSIQKNENDGFPGDVHISITYELLKKSIIIYFDTIATEDTVLNITNHNYYNLSGNYKKTILNHQLTVSAKQFINVDNELIPKNIQYLPPEMDFNKKSYINDKIKYSSSKYFHNGGIDHCYIINGIVLLEDNDSGRKLRLSSSYKTMQIYTCNFNDKNILSNGEMLKKYDAICFEPQHIVSFDGNYDNHPAMLKKNQHYQNFIKLEF